MFLILALQAFGFRWIEAFVVALLGVIAVCFAVQIAMADPDWGAVLRGFAPTTEIVANPEMLYLALGIIGATVMPHNLYLHSGIVQTRAYGDSVGEKREAIKLATIDSTIALMSGADHQCLDPDPGRGDLHIARQDRRRRTRPGPHASWRRCWARRSRRRCSRSRCLCCGLNSTVTATLAGPDRDGRLSRPARRAVAAAAGHARHRDRAGGRRDGLGYGERATGQLLILSQVVLSLQLPFAVVPLVMFTASRAQDGRRSPPRAG